MIEIQERAVYTTNEVANILKISPITVERKIRRGEISATKIGKEYRLLGKDMLSLFGWEDKMWKREYKTILNEMRAEGEKRGIMQEDVSETIEEIRREKLAKAKSSN